MIINRLLVGSYGKFKGLELKLKPGFNLIYGENESGKSTLQAFIKAMFYGMSSQKKNIRENDRKRFMPWDSQRAWGELYFKDEHDNSYIIKRSFGTKKREDEAEVLYEITGEKAPHIQPESPGLDIFGIGEEAFEKTIWIRQLGSEVVRGQDDEMMKRLINLQETGDEDISYHRAVDMLQESKKNLANQRKTGKLDKLKEQFEKLQEEKRNSLFLHKENMVDENLLNELQLMKENTLKNIQQLENQKKQLKLRKFDKEYEDILQYRELKEQLKALAAFENITEQQEIEIYSLEEQQKEWKHKLSNDVKRENLILRKDILKDKSKNWRTLAVLGALCILSGIIGGRLGYGFLYGLSALGVMILALSAFSIRSLNIKIDQLQKEMTSYGDSSNLQEELQRISSRLNQIYRRLGVEDYPSFRQGLSKYREQAKRLDFFMDKLEEELDTVLKENHRELIELEKQIKDKEHAIEQRFFKCKELSQIEEEIERVEEAMVYHENMLSTIDMTIILLQESFQEIQRSFGPRLNRVVGELLGQITGGKYDELKISEDYGIKVIDPLENEIKEMDYFSNGTGDQIYFALRLGLIQLIFGEQHSMPLILDDAFIQYDEKRLEQVLDYLYEYAKGRQVILFTCQRREQKLLDKYNEINYLYL